MVYEVRNKLLSNGNYRAARRRVTPTWYSPMTDIVMSDRLVEVVYQRLDLEVAARSDMPRRCAEVSESRAGAAPAALEVAVRARAAETVEATAARGVLLEWRWRCGGLWSSPGRQRRCLAAWKSVAASATSGHSELHTKAAYEAVQRARSVVITVGGWCEWWWKNVCCAERAAAFLAIARPHIAFDSRKSHRCARMAVAVAGRESM